MCNDRLDRLLFRKCRHFAILMVTAAMFFPAYSLIVWEGKIVAAWPDQHLAKLSKGTAGSLPAAFGFYSNPHGTIYGLTMLVDFSDQPAAFTVAQVKDWLNKVGYSSSTANGSVHDYYYDVSNGQLDLENDVYGYYRAAHPKSYYEGLSGYSGSDVLVSEMMTYFSSSVDFSKYDNDKNGTTEAINFVYAGSGLTWGQGLWPHSGTVNQTKNGVKVGRYNMSDMGTGLSLYVFCHENGHMLFGWPDLYWFGDYCLMANRMSDVNPVPVNDFFRADQGWIPTVDITAGTNAQFKIWPNGTGYRFVNPSNAKQMYYWTNVKNTGRYASLHGKGILMYRFDDGLSGNTSGTSRCLYVVEADGNNAMAAAQWPSPGSAATDFFYSANKTEFSSTTNPASAWGLRIYGISAIADTMTFSAGTGVITIHQTEPKGFPSVLSSCDNGTVFNLLGIRSGFYNSNRSVFRRGGQSPGSGIYIVQLPQSGGAPPAGIHGTKNFLRL